MKLHWPFPRHDRTPYVRFDLHACTGCGKCAAACRRGVLGMIDLPHHKHTHVDHAAHCKGCGLCVAACPNNAVTALARAETQPI